MSIIDQIWPFSRLHFTFWPWKFRSRPWCTMYKFWNGAIRWRIHDFLSVRISNICNISHLLRDICILNTMQKVWPLKWRSRSRSRIVRLVLFDCKCSNPSSPFFAIFYLPGNLLLSKLGPTNTHRKSTWDMVKGKICNALHIFLVITRWRNDQKL